MKKTTQNLLSKRLTQYGAFSISLFGVAEASGQIVYTDIIPDHDQSMGNYMLNVNSEGTLSDAVDDFEIYVNSFSDLRIKPLAPNNEVLGNPYSVSSSLIVYPYALNSSQMISNSATGTWFDKGYFVGVQDLNYDSGARGHWYNVQDKYLGLRFKISGNTHYGWARLDVGSSGASWSIKDYAYNTTPDEPIRPGQKTLAVPENPFKNVEIFAVNKIIKLKNLPQFTNYEVFSMAGQSVLKGKTNQTSYIIEANTLAKGLYIIKMQDVDSNAVLTKKIVL